MQGCSWGMVIPEHGFHPAHQIHHVQQDGFRLPRHLRATLSSVLGEQAELSWNQRVSKEFSGVT